MSFDVTVPDSHTAFVAADLRRIVEAERRRRGWSVRDAAPRGHISNTVWSAWERGDQELTPKLRVAIATAFGWSTGWPENPPMPEPPEDALAEVRAELQAANAKIEALARRLDLAFVDEDGQIVVIDIDPPANVTPLRAARDPAPKTLGRAASGAKDSPPKPTGTKRQRPAPPAEQDDY